MMASLVFTAAALGIFSITFQAYQASSVARYRDEARAVLETFSHQFERLEISDTIPRGSGKAYRRWLFQPVDPPGTGKGLRWNSAGAGSVWNTVSNENTHLSPEPFTNADHLEVYLGGNNNLSLGQGNGILARVTRVVQCVYCAEKPSESDPHYSDNGQTVPATAAEPINTPGTLFLGTFTITYQVNNVTQTQSITVLRAGS